ncbi:MAG: hypothetical protein N2Z21_06435 [Candidatus Sumerlaeaceae bacterium]|nr:hypothetical protein [Candidatus Sumerlaeaceae bacterium]
MEHFGNPDSGASGVGFVAAAANLAAALEEWRDEPAQADKTAIIRAIYILLRKLIPHASRQAVDAIAELVVLELIRNRLVGGAENDGHGDETCSTDGSARIVDVHKFSSR